MQTDADVPLAVQALDACLDKRGMMDAGNRQRLVGRLAKAGVQGLAGLRRFLADGGVRPGVAKALLACLPGADDQRIGDAHLLAHLADGGMGTVWLAERQGRLAVVKILKAGLTEDGEYLQRFEREAAVTAELDHPNVVRCYGHGRDRGISYLCLEYVAGGDVATLIRHTGTLSPEETVRIAMQAAHGLAHAWARHLVHRDIKPANLFIDGGGVVKVADFGLARQVDAESSALTMQGTTVGSPAYMAPEQIRAGAVDCRTDIYSCGCVLFNCLVARPPFLGSVQEVFAKHLTVEAPAVRALRPEIPRPLSDLVARCLRKRPEERFASHDALAGSLESVLHGLGGGGSAVLAPATITLSRRRQAPGDGPAPGRMAEGAHPALDSHTVDCEGPTERLPQRVVVPVTCEVPREPKPAAPSAILDAEAADEDETLGGATDRLEGDWSQALADPCLTLVLPEGRLAVLVAKPAAVFGKLADAPVDIPLRDYPPERHQDSCRRISRSHFRIGLERDVLALTDLDSRNGTLLDGRPLGGGIATALAADREQAVAIPNSVALAVRAIPRRTRAVAALPGAPPAAPGTGLGLATALPWDAVTVRRPRNRLELTYAIVLRRLTVGCDLADITAAMAGPDPLELAIWAGRWIHRVGRDPWRPLAEGPLAVPGMAVQRGCAAIA